MQDRVGRIREWWRQLRRDWDDSQRPSPLAGRHWESGNASVELLTAGDKKIRIIREIRAATGLGLTPAKDLVDRCPSVVVSGVDLAAANQIVDRLNECGATAVAHGS